MEQEILKSLISESRFHYKCFDLLKELFKENKRFKKWLIKGYLTGKIEGFPEELWEKIDSQNIRRIASFEDVFRDGANLGYCTVASKQLSYSLDDCYICGGVVSVLVGTINSIDGSHTWISKSQKVIDTTLMLIMDEKYSKEIGYVEENRYNPNLDSVYLATKEFTRDQNLKGHR